MNFLAMTALLAFEGENLSYFNKIAGAGNVLVTGKVALDIVNDKEFPKIFLIYLKLTDLLEAHLRWL